MGQERVPRYRQIVAELRRRIEIGELAPGDRVPSTREITRRWGVAMATATKVLTELRHEGLVRAVPGVGTVVDGPPTRARHVPTTGERRERRPSTTTAPRGRRTTSEQALTRDRIVATAVAIADAEGLAGVSMRRVAAELGVATMSLYRVVVDKDDLLMRMVDAVFAASPLPANASEGWRARLEIAARTLWGIFRRHPWLAAALSLTRPQLVPSAVSFTEWVLSTLHDRGLDLSTAFSVHLALLNYVRGTAVNLEMEADAEALSGLSSEEWIDAQQPALQAILATGQFPTLERLTRVGYDFDLDDLFEFGLRRLLDGVAVLLEGTA